MGTMIQVEHLYKTFTQKGTSVEALKDVSFEIEKGDIYGIIGLSGAGKSTLVRCLNFLERPTSGKVTVAGQNLAELSEKELRTARQNIGMIFQHFNLLMQRNVLDNIMFPMEIAGVPKKQARERAMELLETVGLSEKASAYPVQLSGGQKQRVAIARVLANNPQVLLCDEATSALDPQTTKSILALLKHINKEYGITIVVITHEMAVVQEICNQVAIIDHGVLAEHGSVEEIFRNPQTEAAKRLVYSSVTHIAEMQSDRCVRIVFTEQSSFEPVIGNMVLEFKMPVNILFADTKNVGGTAKGEMVLQLPPNREISDRMIEYLRERRLNVEELNGYVG